MESAEDYSDDHSLFAVACLDPTDPGRNARVSRAWLERGWEGLFRDLAQAASGRDPRVSAHVTACATERDPVRARRRTPARWNQALELIASNPVVVDATGTIEGKHSSYAHLHLTVTRVVDNNPWVYLTAHAVLGQTFDPGVEYDRWIDFLADVLDDADPGYAEISYDRGWELHTELDNALRRDDRHSVEQSRQQLRGYSWVTVLPRELAERLGGTAAVEAAGAAVEVRRLAAGGLLLRATRTPEQYDEAAMSRLFQLVAPVLPEGLPRDLPGWPTRHQVVYEDAAAYR
jgi:hypothetical protein